MTPLRPPTPVLWAPKFRTHLMKWLTRMDRRKARQMAAKNQSIVDAQWRAAYDAWWMDVGWMEAAMTPQDAWRYVLDVREGRIRP